MDKKYLIGGVAGFLGLMLGFGGGVMYGKDSNSSSLPQGRGIPGLMDRQRAGGFGAGSGFLGGEVMSIDDKSITVKMRDGGSRIVLYSDNTKIYKSTEGAREDIKASAQVTISGKQNSDGSVTADSIQLRDGFILPQMPGGGSQAR